MIDEDLAHRPGGGPEEVRTALPARARVSEHLQIRLVHEGGGLQGVVGALVPHATIGEHSKLAIHERQKLIEGRTVPTAQASEDYRNVVRVAHGEPTYGILELGHPASLGIVA